MLSAPVVSAPDRSPAVTGVSRRRLLLGGLAAGTLAVAGGAGAVGLVETGVLPGRFTLAPYLGQCGPTGRIPTGPSGPVHQGRFSSPSMPGPVGFGFVLPPATPPHGLAVVLFLHGYGEDYRAAFTTYGLGRFLAASRLPMAIASVDGGRDSYWHRRADGQDPPAMIVSGLLPRLRAAGLDPTRLALLGVSMGGFGALLLGASAAHRLPAPFTPSAVAALSPACSTSFRTSPPGAFDSAADWRACDVLAPGALVDVPVRVVCGEQDPFEPAARVLAGRLLAGAVRIGSGCHRPATWLRWIPDQLTFVAAALGVAPGAAHRNPSGMASDAL